MARTRFVCGNWKMFKTQAQARELVGALAPLVAGAAGKVQVAVAPPFTSLAAAAEALGGTAIELAAQNVHWESRGPSPVRCRPRCLPTWGASMVS